jgi:DNA-binding transcriptional MocR family regulator
MRPRSAGEKRKETTRVAHVVAAVTRLIETEALKVGEKLPSIRRAAEEYAVSKNTVIEAYERLAAAGLIMSRPGSGFTVKRRERLAASDRPLHVAEAIDIASLLNAQLEESFSIRVGDGRPPAAWTEESEVRRHLSLHMTRRGREDGYGSALGYPGLRQRLAIDLQGRDLRVTPDQILLTFGANHALDLVIRRFLVAGDTVLVDDPGYYPLFAKLKLAQVEIVGVRRLPTGPEVDDLMAKAIKHRPKIFFTQSIGHNPTGGSTNLATAHAVLKLAARYSFLIVEDEPFVDLPTVEGLRLSALDQLDSVISIGTFSKTLSASLRCGYVAARIDIIASLAELKMLTTVNSSGHVERLVENLMTEGHYRRHLKRLGSRIRSATDQVLQSFDRRGFEVFTKPTGAYYVYLLLPAGLDDIALARAGAKEGIFIAPGSVFTVDKSVGRKGTRINVARASDSRFFNFLGRALGSA